ncbi:hypothetical protein D3C85_1704940 [compost metagenome]
MRGGCSCAGTYGHYLLGIGRTDSKQITDGIDAGLLSKKPGWLRISLHPVMTDREAKEIVRAVSEITSHIEAWRQDYIYDTNTNQFRHRSFQPSEDMYSFFTV